jgi:hypothetical protein
MKIALLAERVEESLVSSIHEIFKKHRPELYSFQLSASLISIKKVKELCRQADMYLVIKDGAVEFETCSVSSILPIFDSVETVIEVIAGRGPKLSVK